MASANGPQPLNEQNFIIPISTGRTIIGAGIGTASVAAIGVNNTRRTITFHNPNNASGANLFVCQALTIAGTPLAAAVDGAGSFTIFPGSSLTFTGSVGGAWNVCASAAASNLTIISDAP